MLKLFALKDYLVKQAPSIIVGRRNLLLALYLADWKHAIENDRPITHVDWAFLENNTVLGALNSVIPHSAWRTWLAIRIAALSDSEREAADHVLDIMARKTLTELQHLVVSTFPAMTRPAGEPLDLADLAREYHAYRACQKQNKIFSS